MDIIKIVLAILLSWGIITLFGIAYKRTKHSSILSGFRITGSYPHDDEEARALTTVPLSTDMRILHLWQAMDIHERLAWHRLMRTLEDEQQRQDKQEAELSNYDSSTARGEDTLLLAQERLDNQREHLLKRARERIDAFVTGIRERLDDEARIYRYLSDRALLSASQAQHNSDRVTEVQISKYTHLKRSKNPFGESSQQKRQTTS